MKHSYTLQSIIGLMSVGITILAVQPTAPVYLSYFVVAYSWLTAVVAVLLLVGALAGTDAEFIKALFKNGVVLPPPTSWTIISSFLICVQVIIFLVAHWWFASLAWFVMGFANSYSHTKMRRLITPETVAVMILGEQVIELMNKVKAEIDAVNVQHKKQKEKGEDDAR